MKSKRHGKSVVFVKYSENGHGSTGQAAGYWGRNCWGEQQADAHKNPDGKSGGAVMGKTDPLRAETSSTENKLFKLLLKEEEYAR